jgi:hypothetical protein
MWLPMLKELDRIKWKNPKRIHPLLVGRLGVTLKTNRIGIIFKIIEAKRARSTFYIVDVLQKNTQAINWLFS